MDVTVKAIHFDVKASLEEFIQKKINKLEQYSDKITSANVTLQVVKPEVSDNKEVMLKVLMPNNELVVTKTADSFEEAFDNAMDAMIRSIKKAKEKANELKK
ncbi:MAG: ribosome-associated translation inhibitor RaiA [Paludibacteraceae bacterium]|nr:ribosome-associated translation inhibitor RaiA [Paludibacteraceae bacterium]MEE3483653.1 ribosome-associated translation inhibitor RaiA [Bacteroidales bacterium]